MRLETHDRDGVGIVECVDGTACVDDALTLVAACIERGSTRLLIESEKLPSAFFDLRSGFAGAFRGRRSRVFALRAEAEAWLASDPDPRAEGE